MILLPSAALREVYEGKTNVWKYSVERMPEWICNSCKKDTKDVKTRTCARCLRTKLGDFARRTSCALHLFGKCVHANYLCIGRHIDVPSCRCLPSHLHGDGYED